MYRALHSSVHHEVHPCSAPIHFTRGQARAQLYIHQESQGESGEDEEAAVLDLANDLAEGSMEGVESVSLVSAEGTHEAVEAALVCAPVYEVVSKT